MVKNKLTSLFNASALLLTITFVITFVEVVCRIHSAIALWLTMNITKEIMIDNRTDAWKPDVNLLKRISSNISDGINQPSFSINKIMILVHKQIEWYSLEEVPCSSCKAAVHTIKSMLAETVCSFHGNDTALFSDFFWNSAFTVVKTSFPTLWALLATLTEIPKMITNYNKIKIQLFLLILNKCSRCPRFFLMNASTPKLSKGFKNTTMPCLFSSRQVTFDAHLLILQLSKGRTQDIHVFWQQNTKYNLLIIVKEWNLNFFGSFFQ